MAASHGIALTVPMITDNLFTERALPTSQGRSVVSLSSSTGVFHFFDGRREKTNESLYLQQNGIPAQTARVIAKINQHKPELSALGILPNQIRTLLKGSLDSSEFMEDVSKTLFWSVNSSQMLLRNGRIGKTAKRLRVTDPSIFSAG